MTCSEREEKVLLSETAAAERVNCNRDRFCSF